MRAPLLRNLMLLMLVFAASSPAQAGTAFSLKGGRGVGGLYAPAEGDRGVPPFRARGGDQHPSGNGMGDGPLLGGCRDRDRRSFPCDRPQPPVISRPPQSPVVFRPQQPPVVFSPRQPPPIFSSPAGSNLVFTGAPVGGRPAASTVGPIAILMALLGAGALTWRWLRRAQKKSHDPRTRIVGVPDFGRQSISFLGSVTNVRGSSVTVTRSRDLKPVLLSSASMKGA
jgi:hypothetical protein